ncbi:MAG: hypothetical protein IT204_02645 [Fimbriimonadaceae bacterium]|nr:hypothetical protein [Fimbriimonadaceae bacterium]
MGDRRLELPAPRCWQLDFSAKLWWRLRHDRRPWLAARLDKLALREYAARHGVATAPLLAVVDDPRQLDFAAPPDDCFVQATNASGRNLVRLAGQLYQFGNGEACAGAAGYQALATAPLSEPAARHLLARWLAQPYHLAPWAQALLQPRVIVEPLLQPRVPPVLYDYRCLTFDGRVRTISVACPLDRQRGQAVFFDRHWQPFGLTRYREALPDPLPARPANLEAMLATAELLAAGLDFVQVDRWDTTAGLLLGELTIYPDAGALEAPSGCRAFNCWLAGHWPLPPAAAAETWVRQRAWWAWRRLCGSLRRWR